MAKYSVDFDTMDAAVQRYLRLYKCWPATYRVLPQNERSFIIYRILPDAADTNNNERLGDIEISKIPGGTLLEFKEGYTEQRKYSTTEESRALLHAQRDAANRLRPKNYDGDDEEQFAALRELVEQDTAVLKVKLDLMARPIEEAQARRAEYGARMEEVKAGLLDWLAEHGIEEAERAAGGVEPEDAPGGDVSKNSDALIRPAYRHIVDLWNEGYTAREISIWDGVTLSEGRIRNIITDERKRIAKEFGKERARALIKYHGK